MLILKSHTKPKPSSSSMKIEPSNFQTEWRDSIHDDWHKRERFWKNLTLKKLQENIKRGFDVNAQNEKGKTPLHQAVYHNVSIAIIKKLRKAGADVNAKDKKGDTPFLLAASRSNAEIIKELKPKR